MCGLPLQRSDFGVSVGCIHFIWPCVCQLGTVRTKGLGCLGKPRLDSGKSEELPLCRNEAVVISGQKLARQIRQEACHEVEQWVAAGHKRPHLSVVLVGENPASHSYVLNKTRAAADVGEFA